MPTTTRPGAGAIAGALLIVYVVWGSTYLGIRVVVEEAPPLLSMGSRFGLAGLVLGLLLTLRGGVRRLAATRRELLGCALVGLLLPLLGNGVVAIAEQDVPSGLAALLVASTPLMISVFRVLARDWPSPWTIVGVVIGFLGVAALVFSGRSLEDREIPLGPTLLVVLAATFWALGSWIQPRLTLPHDPFVMTTYEMLFGGLMMMAVGALRGEELHPGSYSATVWLAWAYLLVFGSMIAFTAYVWLLANAPISFVATYAYVNPVVAVFLGALLLDEQLTPGILLSGAIIVASVAIVISVERRARTD